MLRAANMFSALAHQRIIRPRTFLSFPITWVILNQHCTAPDKITCNLSSADSVHVGIIFICPMTYPITVDDMRLPEVSETERKAQP